MKHTNVNVGDYYWTVRSMTCSNAVCLVRVKIVEIGQNDDPLIGRWCLCTEARDTENPYASELYFDGTQAVTPFWTKEAYLYDSVDAAMDRLQLAINDGIKEMRDFFQAMRDNGAEPNTRNQISMFPLDIIDMKDVKSE